MEVGIKKLDEQYMLVQQNFDGGEENRTPVRRLVEQVFSERSARFDIPSVIRLRTS